MDLNTIANELVAGCLARREDENLDRLYSPEAVSVEAMSMNGMDPTSRGLDAIKGKHQWWNASFDVHSVSVEGPFLHGDDRFAVIFETDVTQKETGQKITGREVAVYHVADGKIVREEFFYTGG